MRYFATRQSWFQWLVWLCCEWDSASNTTDWLGSVGCGSHFFKLGLGLSYCWCSCKSSLLKDLAHSLNQQTVCILQYTEGKAPKLKIWLSLLSIVHLFKAWLSLWTTFLNWCIFLLMGPPSSSSPQLRQRFLSPSQQLLPSWHRLAGKMRNIGLNLWHITTCASAGYTLPNL